MLGKEKQSAAFPVLLRVLGRLAAKVLRGVLGDAVAQHLGQVHHGAGWGTGGWRRLDSGSLC